ncbi:predicted protein [Plenodomus lingam JN3]|uniref:Predicted protein n=1 Tax=Leptosphaeria maculans (strain JN3 / isolate v23.1.3 / race Av1-4-5-6-7-8) TaxID=985895 RepID=E5A0L5_LEPMJ|nr:predicted protein [Plenodomus lingam JN3]CBX97075.1 predicted protein [Plenodomus lingam JN3]
MCSDFVCFLGRGTALLLLMLWQYELVVTLVGRGLVFNRRPETCTILVAMNPTGQLVDETSTAIFAALLPKRFLLLQLHRQITARRVYPYFSENITETLNREFASESRSKIRKMPKTVVFTTITPLPVGITRKSVLDMYKDHVSMIDLNPLVVERYACRPPSYAPTDEYWSTWYTIKDRVSYLPGGLAQGSVSYHACFNDCKDGLETHVYAPLGLEIRGKWSVGGRLPGEPKPPCEPGLEGSETWSLHSLVEKLVERAHILESNFANERLQALRNVDPGERMGHGDIFIAPPPDYEGSDEESDTISPGCISHLRCHSDPVLSPGFSSSSTLYDQNVNEPSETKDEDRSDFSRRVLEEKSISTSAPEPHSILLPAKSYEDDIAKQPRPALLCPNLQTERIISLLPLSPRSPRDSLDSPVQHALDSAHYLPYDAQDRPISFTFSFDPRSPFDKRSTSESPHSSQQHLLDDIDNAIDEVFQYTSPPPATTAEIVQAKKCDILLATKFDQSQDVLPQTTYAPKRKRKDSVVPLHEYVDKELPALPLVSPKDQKWRKTLGL